MNKHLCRALLALCILGAAPGIRAAQEDCAELRLAAVALPPALVGTSYSQNIKAYGGKTPVSLSLTAGTLPPGLTLKPTGVLNGVPAAPGTYTLIIAATDSCHPAQRATRSLTLRVLENGETVGAGQPSVVRKAPLAVTVTPVPAVVPLKAGTSGARVTYRFVARPADTTVLESPGFSFLVAGAVVESVATPLSATIINGAAELAEEIVIPAGVLTAARRSPGAKILFNRAFMGRGTTAAAVVEFVPAAP